MDGREENNARMGQNHFMKKAQNMQNYCRANARGIFLLFFFANFHFLLAGRETYLTPPTPSESTANAPTNRNPETHERKPRPPISESHDQCEGDSPNACPAGQSCVNHLCQCAQGSVFLNGKCQIVAACKADPECDKNAICIINLFGKNTCQCKPGYIDVDIITPGRECAKDHAFQEDYSTPVVMVVEQKTPNGTRCGDNYCQDELNEVCVGGSQCKCRPGYGRANPGDKCEPMEKTPLTFRVVTVGNKPLTFSSTEYGTSGSPSYVEFAKEFTNDLGKAVGTTEYAPRYLTTDINYITHPKTVNSSWPDGLLVNFTVGTRPGDKPVDACDLWKQLMESIQKTNGQIGGGRQQVATDIELLSPCPKEQGPLCGGKVCRPELGEFCIGDEICGCPEGQKRAGPDDHCRVVESWTFPLWVIRKNQYTIDYNDTFANPADTLYRQYIQSLENGIHQSYLQTPLRNSFVTSEVIDLMNPNLMNGTWEHGVLFNTTMYFRVGTVPKAQDTYNQLIRWIIDRNNYQVGQSGLYLNPYQPNPFGACYKNDCHREAICYETGKNSYRCECPAGFRDMLPSFPGHACLATKDINECENATLNDCSTNARCIDLEYLYRCECLDGFKDESPKGAIPGSVCQLDVCSGVNFCPVNSTCVNSENEAKCICKSGFVDLRIVDESVRVNNSLHPDQFCLLAVDVNECALGLDDCSAVADCIDLRMGYTCKCHDGYIDGNLSLPGRICAGLTGDLCNGHGSAIYNGTSNSTMVCVCDPGWEGEFCAIGASKIPLILFLILALLFLLLTLCCLLYLCSRLRCWRRKKQESEDSLYGQALEIPRAKLDEDLGSMASSEYTIREEVERHVTTEVTRMEEQLVGGETVYEEHSGDRSHAVQQSASGEFYSSSGNHSGKK